jgi:hypothetical protein
MQHSPLLPRLLVPIPVVPMSWLGLACGLWLVGGAGSCPVRTATASASQQASASMQCWPDRRAMQCV